MKMIDSDILLEKLNDRLMNSCGYEHTAISGIIEMVNDMICESIIKGTGDDCESRKDFLEAAMNIVCHDRESQYGSPEDNFRNIAILWSDYADVQITSKDVAIMMALMKIARIKGGAFKQDSWVDAIGYLACGAEITCSEE